MMMKNILQPLVTMLIAFFFSLSSLSQDVDKTSLVNTDASAWNGNWCATQFAPEVTTADGRTAQMVENFQSGGCDLVGMILSQMVTGLENGVYTVVLYANALSTHERDGFESEVSDGDTDIAYVFAGKKEKRISAGVATSVTANGEYTIENVVVTNGSLLIGLGKDKPGTNWHTIQIKSLVWNKPAQAFYEWVNGEYTIRYTNDLDSITFTLPDNLETDDDLGSDEDSIPANLPKYAVDLGLPSGTLWADHNVGANSPEDYGDYFAWGEITSKSIYGSNNYTGFVKKDFYNDEGYLFGDAATNKWGDKWRMPTIPDFYELITYCEAEVTSVNGVEGIYFTGKNGNRIFMPYSGIMDGDSNTQNKINGFYWTTSRTNNDKVWAYEISDTECVNSSIDPYKGLSIRPIIYSESANICPNNNHPHLIDLGLPSGKKWSCCNVGAEHPHGYGNYYAWGDIDAKDYFSSNYTNKWIDDTATKNQGAKFRMPTREELEELMQNCKKEHATIQGTEGIILTGRNGNKIFLPFSGHRWIDKTYARNIYAFYTTTSKVTDNTIWMMAISNGAAYETPGFRFDEEFISGDGSGRGRVVRAVGK